MRESDHMGENGCFHHMGDNGWFYHIWLKWLFKLFVFSYLQPSGSVGMTLANSDLCKMICVSQHGTIMILLMMMVVMMMILVMKMMMHSLSLKVAKSTKRRMLT